ncbi:MAG: glycosyltransferase [Acidobacteria bacterium]|nr:glycosyltransferase [Acidobacteriota bacterium]
MHSGNLFGGLETFLIALARFRGLCPEMEPEFALAFEGRLATELRREGVAVHALGEVRGRNPRSVLRARAELRRLIETGRFNVAMTHSTWTQSLLAKEIRRARLPYAFYLHEITKGRAWVDIMARWTPPDIVICDSRYTAVTTSNVLYPGAPWEVLYCASAPVPPAEPGVRERVRRELGSPIGGTVIIQVSRMEEWKGHRLHLEALGLLRDLDGWECWMVGGAQRPMEIRYLESLRRQASTLGIAERLRFLGQRSDVPALLRSADIHCQPNTGPEPFGLTFIEALSAGLPVVTTAMGGPLEIVDPSCGLLVPPAPSALAEGLRRVITDRKLREALGAGGPPRARLLCDPAQQLHKLRTILGRVGESRR